MRTATIASPLSRSLRTLRILACATQGTGSDDETRLRALVSTLNPTFLSFNKREKRQSAFRLLRAIQSRQFNLLVLEGTGFAAGIAAIIGRKVWGVPYVVSSGDAVAPFLSLRHPIGKPFYVWYEQSLYSNASGFIGWTPYLVGRALTYGVTRAMTVPGWASYVIDKPALERARRATRERLGIPSDSVVFGLVGSLNWSHRFSYCYGAELVRAARLTDGKTIVVVIGDGTGLDKLRELAGDALGKTIFLPGRISRDQVPAHLAAIDVGCIPQSVDRVGTFRYTTKLSEYKAAGLPYVSNQIPMTYDLDDGSVWRLPGNSPWDPIFLGALAKLMKDMTHEVIRTKMSKVTNLAQFDKEAQLARTTAFLLDILEMTSRRLPDQHTGVHIP